MNSASSMSVLVTGQTSTVIDAGGLEGFAIGNPSQFIAQSYATGAVSVIGGSAQSGAGGLIGLNVGAILNCYSTGSVSISSAANLGGFAGIASQVDGAVSSIKTSYSIGAVTGAGGDTGGFVGDDNGDGFGILTGNVWDTTTSGISNPAQGAG